MELFLSFNFLSDQLSDKKLNDKNEQLDFRFAAAATFWRLAN